MEISQVILMVILTGIGIVAVVAIIILEESAKTSKKWLEILTAIGSLIILPLITLFIWGVLIILGVLPPPGGRYSSSDIPFWE